MSWQQLNVTIDIIPRNNKWFKQSKNVLFTKQLLANLNGHAVPGKIVAIMGSSGAGISFNEEKKSNLNHM
ncbi:unnamed protein product [Adineta steineri]|uniref:Uncharacterized protein n=2 Tax=Adineta steineri TaxID=433720 RepID=A0A813RMX0_9BILA|nr:unnamed protein product [Adineta steineri]